MFGPLGRGGIVAAAMSNPAWCLCEWIGRSEVRRSRSRRAPRRRQGSGLFRDLAAEEGRQARFGNIGGIRRPDHVLQAMRRGEPVEVSVSLIPIPRELREQRGWRMGDRVMLFPDM